VIRCRINVDDPLSAVRIILPDAGVFFVTLLILIACRALIHDHPHPVDAGDAAANTTLTEAHTPTEHRRLFKYGAMIGDFLGNFVVVMLMGACGIAVPSIINCVYFALFVAVATLWACCVRSRGSFAMLRYMLLTYVAAHVILIYLTQFEFMQHAWDNHGNETLAER